jgi:(1->4)-alpha-D-glucan 1-alpha-D-glucosylmutase
MVSRYGVYNSLSQTLLKICSPGVPDFYQGTELWGLSLVDPDNRRPVDFERRIHMLEGLDRKGREMAGADFARELMQTAGDGRIKLYVIQKALTHRRARQELYGQGEYLPLTVQGPRAANVCAFARRKSGIAAIIAVPRLLRGLDTAENEDPFENAAWEETALLLPEDLQGLSYGNVFTGERITASGGERTESIMLSTLFGSLPVALLERLPA